MYFIFGVCIFINLYQLGPTPSHAISPLVRSTSRGSVSSEGEDNSEHDAENLAGYGSDWSVDNDSSSTSLIEVTDHLEIDRY